MNNYIITIFIFFFTFKRSYQVTLQNCDSYAPIQVALFDSPANVTLQNNLPMLISFNVSSQEDGYVLSQWRVKFQLYKKMGLLYLRVPCTGCDFSINIVDTPWLYLFRKMCKGCSMSFKDLTAYMPKDIEQKLPSYLPNFALAGDYRLRVDILDDFKEEMRIACFDMQLMLALKKST